MTDSYWIDSHCDVLLKIWEGRTGSLFYEKKSSLDVTFPALRQERVLLQNFAVFVPPTVPYLSQYEVAQRQVEMFYECIIGENHRMRPILSSKDMDDLSIDQPGALLSIEGGDCLGRELDRLHQFYQLGVRQLSLTWNHGNAWADGIGEKRGYGLTKLGRELVEEMRRMGMIIDVSHLSEKGFWDVIEWEPELPMIASHSNCYTICPHRRNLTDLQIQALIERKGLLGITFVPSFVYEPYQKAKMEHLFHHIDHVIALGGADHIAFGSDFDGMVYKLPELDSMYDLHHLKKALRNRYPEEWVEKWAWKNAFSFYKKALS